MTPVPARPLDILFVGNSFTFGATSPVEHYRAGSVTDLNGESVGGVPALVKRFADQAGVPVRVSIETSPGKTLQWHFENRQTEIDGRWDHVVLQEYSTLDPQAPGDDAATVDYAGRLARLVKARSPDASVSIVATWSRPDLTVPKGKRWTGMPIDQMAKDLRAAMSRVQRVNPAIGRVHPVGEAFTCAITSGIADANPYDGIDQGKVDLWGPDHYHAATPGYYLEALVLFAGLTGRDPRALGPHEKAAGELGIDPGVAAKLQTVAWQMVYAGGCRPASVR